MTDDSHSDDRVTTRPAFAQALSTLIAAARANGVNVAGAWECRTNGSSQDWEAVITELATTDGGE